MLYKQGWKSFRPSDLEPGMKTLMMAVVKSIANSPALFLYMVVPADWDGESLPWQTTTVQ